MPVASRPRRRRPGPGASRSCFSASASERVRAGGVDDGLQLGRQRPDDARLGRRSRGARSTSGRATAAFGVRGRVDQDAPLPTSATIAPLPDSLNLPSLSENTACSLASQRALPLRSTQTLACATDLAVDAHHDARDAGRPGRDGAAPAATKAATQRGRPGDVRCSCRDMEALVAEGDGCAVAPVGQDSRRECAPFGPRRNRMRGFHAP